MNKKPLLIVVAIMVVAVALMVKIGFFDALLTTSSFHATQQKAEQGDAPAQLELGKKYLHGVGVEKDEYEALSWVLKSAEQSYPAGMRLAGLMYRDGHGTVKHPEASLRWLKRAFDASDAMSAYFIGNIYEQGEGVEKNIETAFSWYQQGADRGDSWSQYALGELYQYEDRGYRVDIRKALRWYQLSAKSGNLLAQHEMGRLYSHGIGVDKDLNKAELWYRRSIEQDYWMAKNNLAWILSTADDDAFRDGKVALKIIESIDMDELAEDSRLAVLDTYAAVYAEAGRFVDAVMAQERAVAMFKKSNADHKEIEGAEKRLHFYQQKKPWREGWINQ